jgi:hypothetical protein
MTTAQVSAPQTADPAQGAAAQAIVVAETSLEGSADQGLLLVGSGKRLRR